MARTGGYSSVTVENRLGGKMDGFASYSTTKVDVKEWVEFPLVIVRVSV
jgi:hypothetical protein